ncbi:retrovirus-related pol polyprotein from transposon TNT 1-94 [Tanacetum coccineum]
MPGCSWRGHLRGTHIHYCSVFLEGIHARGIYSLLPGVLGGDTCKGYIFISARVFLEGTPVIGIYGFHYCPGVLGGDTYDGYIMHRFHELRLIVEPKNFKTDMAEAWWFEAMQEEIHEFDRLHVWELVPKPDCVMIITLKWIYKVKLDEYGDVLKNKARLAAKRYRQMDMKTALLNGELKKEVYVSQPEGFVDQ